MQYIFLVFPGRLIHASAKVPTENSSLRISRSELLDDSLLTKDHFQRGNQVILLRTKSAHGDTTEKEQDKSPDFTVSLVFLHSFNHPPDLSLSFLEKKIQNLEIKQEEECRSLQYQIGILFNKPSKELLISLGTYSSV